MAIVSSDPTAAHLPELAAGSVDAILGLFGREPVIDSPGSGRVAGRGAVAAFVASQAEWFRERLVELEPLRTTVGRGLALTESHIDAECFISLLQILDPKPDDYRARAEYMRRYRQLRETLEIPLPPQDPQPGRLPPG